VVGDGARQVLASSHDGIAPRANVDGEASEDAVVAVLFPSAILDPLLDLDYTSLKRGRR